MSLGKESMLTLLVIATMSGMMQAGLAPQYHSQSLIKPGTESNVSLMQVPHNYIAGNFYHWKLTSIIREKITGLTDDSKFHFALYKLLWKKSHDSPPI